MMKKMILAALALIGIATVSPQANADSRVAGCVMEFNVRKVDVAIFSGGGGSGLVTCRNVGGIPYTQAPVDIEIDGLGVGLGFYQFEGVTGNIGVLDIRELEGTYAVIDANAAALLAAGANFGLKGERNGLSIAANGRLGLGLGAGVFGSTWRIRLR